MLIFTALKEYTGRAMLALRSWRECYPDARIVVFSEDAALVGGGSLIVAETKGDEVVARNLDLTLRFVRTNKHGTPLVSDMFSQVLRYDEETFLFVTSDLILLGDLGIVAFALRGRSYVAVGKRKDLHFPRGVDFTRDDWRERLRARAKVCGRRASPCGSDFFLFTPNVYAEEAIPPFAMGRCRYDNWLMWDALQRQDVALVDVTPVVTVIHQVHPTNAAAWRGPEIKENERLARAKYPGWTPFKGWTSQAELVLTEEKLAGNLMVRDAERTIREGEAQKARAAAADAIERLQGIVDERAQIERVVAKETGEEE